MNHIGAVFDGTVGDRLKRDISKKLDGFDLLLKGGGRIAECVKQGGWRGCICFN